MSKVFIKQEESNKDSYISIKIYTKKELEKYVNSKDFQDDLRYMEEIIKRNNEPAKPRQIKRS